MRIALGLKARTGRAILVAVGIEGNELRIIERCEIKLLPEGSFAPYHAAEKLKPEDARKSVKNSVAAAHQLAESSIRAALKRMMDDGHEVVGIGVLVGSGIPNWTIAEILAAHVRMHKAEGELFRNVLVEGVKAAGLKITSLPQKSPIDEAAERLDVTRKRIDLHIATLGKQAGAPWGQHQKEATVAAIVAIRPTLL